MKIKKLRIENCTHTLVIKNPELRTDKQLGTLRVHDRVELLLPDTCIAFGVPFRMQRLTFH